MEKKSRLSAHAISQKPIFDFQFHSLHHNQELDERTLVAALKSGDEAAYTYLYDHYSGALFGAILQIVCVKAKAEDVLQEVFIKVYNNMEAYDAEKGRLFTWLLRIARNTAIDTVRSKDFRNTQNQHEFDLERHTQEHGTDEQARHDTIGLNRVLQELKDEHKKIIDLAYFRGLTGEEIAQVLAIPVGTVKSRARSAMMQLKKIVKGRQS